MAQSTASEEPVRSTGRVVRFADRKGFGFIKPDDGGDDLFVHHTNIVSDGGYRSLTVDDIVEFTVVLSDSKYQATNVTAPGGAPITNKKNEISPKRGGFWRRSNNGGYGSGGRGCYNCGNSGHIAKDCNSNANNGGGGECFKCGETGHFMRDCPNGNNGGGSGGGACYNCGAFGHLARECRGNGGGGSGSGACFNCGGYGHLARECTSARGESGGRYGGGGGVGGGGGGSGCFNCGKEGHFARECPNTN